MATVGEVIEVIAGCVVAGIVAMAIVYPICIFLFDKGYGIYQKWVDSKAERDELPPMGVDLDDEYLHAHWLYNKDAYGNNKRK